MKFIFSISGLQASVFSYVSEFHTKETAPRAASFVSMFMPMIFIYSAVLGILIIPMNWRFSLYFIEFVPWRLYIISISSVNALNTLLFAFLPETPKFLLAMNQPDEALNVLRSMYKMNTGYLKEVWSIYSYFSYSYKYLNEFHWIFIFSKSYPVYHLVRETSTNSVLATKGFTNMLKLVWDQTKPIFVPPYSDSTAKLCFMVVILFAIGHGTMLW